MLQPQEEGPPPDSSSSSSSPSTSKFTLSPRGDFMDILATKVTRILLKNADGPINDLLDQHLPNDTDEIREKLPFYESTVDLLKFQRDQYLVGPKYAKENEERRRRQKQQQQEGGGDDVSEREQEHQQQQRFQPPTLAPFRRPFNIAKRRGYNTMTTMPFDATALGHIQIVNICQSFIPSPTVKNLLLPILIDLPSGGLRDPIINTAANSLLLAQPLLDKAMISSIKNVLDNPNMRQVIKNRTQGVLRVDIDVTDHQR
mmetsp:Transcript_28179/g.68531  ORF Transcript_28179/g.68531 Transcript_28179/m.68531 type:complete len:258 (+) Transcript_28179:128-901(+)